MAPAPIRTKDRVVTFRTTPSEFTALQNAAAERNLTVSDLIRLGTMAAITATGTVSTL